MRKVFEIINLKGIRNLEKYELITNKFISVL